ncbi:uncharacterized protein LOC130746325 [Lotus japonicus]|uniref:uncharacterized protein LOC130746325 n=1 Tax=Lotus japonicus TaxID=34305 RepID=UPI002582DEE7|nr:uncharacterized protein LOC130746325 [Lotus japonicus]
MASSRSMKKETDKRPNTLNNDRHSSVVAIKSLPRDLLVEVVASVASHSFIDLHNLKMCSKDFLDATEDKYVWQQVSLDAFPLIQWSSNDKTSSFLEQCRKSENIESLYREGLLEYSKSLYREGLLEYSNYSGGNIDGLEILKIAAQKGHKEANYVCVKEA